MRIFKSLYVQVIIAIILGAAFGAVSPENAAKMKPLGDAFISLLKMVIGPIIFTTVVTGIANSGSMKKVGRVGGKALLYFEVVSTLALALGLLMVNLLKPGVGFNVDPSALDASQVSQYSHAAQALSTTDFLLSLIPTTFLNAFTGSGSLLQILFVALLVGYALVHLGEKVRIFNELLQAASLVLFKIIHFLMRLAPIGAFGAMAFTIGKYGVESFGPLLKLIGVFYLTCIAFVVIVLGLIARQAGFSIFRFVWYVRDELLTVLGTSSSESVLAPMMEKLERLGCSRPVVGLVVPTGYSFNLDGTNIYMTLAAVFVAQAMNIPLSLGDQLGLLVVAMLTSKGASGVTGAGFIALAATLSAAPTVPVAGLTLILGIDRFMSEARALTNLIGNGVATIVISKWEGELDGAQLTRELHRSVSLNQLDAELERK